MCCNGMWLSPKSPWVLMDAEGHIPEAQPLKGLYLPPSPLQVSYCFQAPCFFSTGPGISSPEAVRSFGTHAHLGLCEDAECDRFGDSRDMCGKANSWKLIISCLCQEGEGKKPLQDPANSLCFAIPTLFAGWWCVC